MEYSFRVDEMTFKFATPGVSQLDKCLAKAWKAPVRAAIDLCEGIVSESQKAEWDLVIGRRPGIAVQVMNIVLADLGFNDPPEKEIQSPLKFSLN